MNNLWVLPLLLFLVTLGGCGIFDERSVYSHPVSHPDADNPKTYVAASKEWKDCRDRNVQEEILDLALGQSRKVENPDYGKGSPVCNPLSNPIGCGQATGAYAGSSNSSLYIYSCSCNADCKAAREKTEKVLLQCMADKGWQLRAGEAPGRSYGCSKTGGPMVFEVLNLPRAAN